MQKYTKRYYKANPRPVRPAVDLETLEVKNLSISGSKSLLIVGLRHSSESYRVELDSRDGSFFCTCNQGHCQHVTHAERYVARINGATPKPATRKETALPSRYNDEEKPFSIFK